MKLPQKGNNVSRQCPPVGRVLEDIRMMTWRLASTIEEWVKALRLVYQVYQQAGVIQSSKYQLRVTPYHVLSSTDVFVAAERGTVLATASLIRDGLFGIPAETAYPDEIRDWRKQKRVFGEIACLAMEATEQNELRMLLGLLRLAVQYARFTEHLDDVFLAVHPRHVPFYQRVLGFEAVGDIRHYPGMTHLPMVLLVLDMTVLKTKHPRAHELLFGNRFPPEQLWPTRLPLDQRRLLEPFVDKRFFPVPLSTDPGFEQCDPAYVTPAASPD